MVWAIAQALEVHPMTRAIAQPDQPPRVTDLLIRQKCEAMIEYGYVALRQFPKAERAQLGL
ncbi:MAG: hypothetical protein RLZ81_586 [Pseudomonadota bacterium]|jgi:hypothetical protein